MKKTLFYLPKYIKDSITISMRNDLISDILTEENMSDKIINMDFASLYPSQIEFSDEFRTDIVRERRNDIIDDILIDTQSEDEKE